MEFADIIQGSSMMEYCILGGLADRVEERLKRTYTNNWVKTLQKIADNLFQVMPEESSLYILASTAVDLASRSSNVDFYIDIGNACYNQELTCALRQAKYSHLYYYLRKHGINEIFHLRESISGSRVPVLRLTHKMTGVDVNITVGNGVGVESSVLLRIYMSSDTRVKWLVLTVQEWAAQTGVLSTETQLRPDALTWLVLFFLMQTSPPVVCPVIDLLEAEPKRIIGGWNCSFVKNLPPTENTEQRIDLLVQFLNFITSVDFLNYVICPLTGYLIPKSVFSMPKHLPSSFLPYQLQVMSGKMPYLITDTPICIEDPLDLCHNITEMVDGEVVPRFVAVCKDSLEACRLV